MSNLENITNKILAQAKQQAAEIEAEAREFSDEYLAKQTAKAKAQADQLIDKARTDAEHKKAMMLSSAKLKSRDELLRAKQTVLAKTFDLAKTALANLDDETLKSFISRTLASLDLKGSEKLIVPKDKLELMQSWNLPLEIVQDEHIQSGFQVLDGQTKLNFSFEDLVNQAKESMEGDIISQLFSGEV